MVNILSLHMAVIQKPHPLSIKVVDECQALGHWKKNMEKRVSLIYAPKVVCAFLKSFPEKWGYLSGKYKTGMGDAGKRIFKIAVTGPAIAPVTWPDTNMGF